VRVPVTERLVGSNRPPNTGMPELGAGLPGDQTTVVLLYLAMRSLLIDELTVPDVLAPYPYDQLVADMVGRILPRR
jgi:hypothetical protein